jgi:H+/Cl- antiporter ClcA
MNKVGNMKFFIALALLGTVFLSFLFGLWVYSNPQARKEKIDEYKEKILKKERRFWYNNKD